MNVKQFLYVPLPDSAGTTRLRWGFGTMLTAGIAAMCRNLPQVIVLQRSVANGRRVPQAAAVPELNAELKKRFAFECPPKPLPVP